jgi:hypothetical protein
MALKWLLAIVALATLAIGGLLGCTKSAEQEEEEQQIASDYSSSADTESSGWQEAEHDIAVDEGLVTPGELAESGENLPPNLTGEEAPHEGEAAGKEETEGGGEAPETVESGDTGFDGASVYKNARCDVCHGDSRQGTELGPPLLDLKPYWDQVELERFFLDPANYEPASDHLQKIRDQYKDVMPAWNLSGEEMAALIDWLLIVKEENEQQ